MELFLFSIEHCLLNIERFALLAAGKISPLLAYSTQENPHYQTSYICTSIKNGYGEINRRF